jgi:hypothetical protein
VLSGGSDCGSASYAAHFAAERGAAIQKKAQGVAALG